MTVQACVMGDTPLKTEFLKKEGGQPTTELCTTFKHLLGTACLEGGKAKAPQCNLDGPGTTADMRGASTSTESLVKKNRSGNAAWFFLIFALCHPTMSIHVHMYTAGTQDDAEGFFNCR